MKRSHRVTGILLACLICNAGARCQKPDTTPMSVGQRSAGNVAVRDVRILLVNGQPRCRISISGPFTIRANNDAVLRGRSAENVTVAVDPQRGILFGDRGLGHGVFDVVPEHGATISLARQDGRKWIAPRRYPGYVRLSIDGRDRLRVVNFVDIETYVACVLPGEMPTRFHREAQRAQTVAIRTYVLYEMASRSHRAHDVQATEASQVYMGLQADKDFQRARATTDSTRGIVGTWASPDGEHIVCMFYSSCCGGMTQNVTNIKRDFPPTAPLAGGVRCDCYKTAKGNTYNWPTTSVSKSEVTAKLVARYPKLRTLGRIERIHVVERTDAGRPKILELVGAAGQASRMLAEDFRLAVGSRVIRSTNCYIRSEPERFVFANGRGFGHGMGMCQWGAEAMALDGHSAARILKHYYPTLNLTRAY